MRYIKAILLSSIHSIVRMQIYDSIYGRQIYEDNAEILVC